MKTFKELTEETGISKQLKRKIIAAGVKYKSADDFLSSKNKKDAVDKYAKVLGAKIGINYLYGDKTGVSLFDNEWSSFDDAYDAIKKYLKGFSSVGTK
jgi:hypothetical protein